MLVDLSKKHLVMRYWIEVIDSCYALSFPESIRNQLDKVFITLRNVRY